MLSNALCIFAKLPLIGIFKVCIFVSPETSKSSKDDNDSLVVPDSRKVESDSDFFAQFGAKISVLGPGKR